MNDKGLSFILNGVANQTNQFDHTCLTRINLGNVPVGALAMQQLNKLIPKITDISLSNMTSSKEILQSIAEHSILIQKLSLVKVKDLNVNKTSLLLYKILDEFKLEIISLTLSYTNLSPKKLLEIVNDSLGQLILLKELDLSYNTLSKTDANS